MEGYAKLAAFMSQHPESAQVLRFSEFNLQNILYIQAEIHGLLGDLRKLEAEANASPNGDSKYFATDWYTLAHTVSDAGAPNRQWQIVLRLRRLIAEYSIDPR